MFMLNHYEFKQRWENRFIYYAYAIIEYLYTYPTIQTCSGNLLSDFFKVTCYLATS